MNIRVLLLFLLLPSLAYTQVDSLKLPLVKFSPVAIVKRHFQAEYGITYITFTNGLQIALRPTAGSAQYPADTAVYIKVERLHQAASYANADLTAVRVGGYLVRKAGIVNLNGNQLSQYLKGNKLYLDGTGSRFSTGVDLRTDRSQVETALRVLHAFFTQPSSDTSAYRLALNELIASYRQPRTNLSAEAMIEDSVRHVLYCSGDQLTADDLLTVDPARIHKLVKQTFGNASELKCTVAGNFELEAVIGWLQQYMGNLPSTGKQPRSAPIDDCSFPAPRLQKAVYVPGATTAVVHQTFLTTYKRVKPGDTKLVEALSQTLRKRLNERFKQDGLGSRVLVTKESGGIVNGTSLQNRRVGITVRISCKPAAVDSVKAVVRTELRRLARALTPEEELSGFQKSVSQRNGSLTENGYAWNLILWNSIFVGEWPIQSNAGAKAISPKTLRNTARRFVNTRDIVSLTFLPDPRR